MNQKTESPGAIPAVQVLPQDAGSLPMIHENQSVHLALDAPAMDQMDRLAHLMATARATVPREYVGNPGDCLAVVMQAVQWRMNPFALAQKTFFASGKIGYEAQLINAVVQSLAPTKDRFHYEWFGPWEKVVGKFEIKKGDKGEYRVPGWKLADEEGIGIRIWATLKGEDSPRILELLLAQARTRNSTLWADDPKQQLAYLAVKRWARLYCPDVILGVYSPDEVEQIVEREIQGETLPQERKSGPDRLKAAVKDRVGPALFDVLAKIDAMVTKEQRQEAQDLAAKLLDPADIEAARAAYKARYDVLKAQADKATSAAPAAATGETIDNDTGEVTGAAAAVTYAQVEDQLKAAKTEDDLAIAADLIQYVTVKGAAEDLGKVYKKRAAELKGGE